MILTNRVSSTSPCETASDYKLGYFSVSVKSRAVLRLISQTRSPTCALSGQVGVKLVSVLNPFRCGWLKGGSVWRCCFQQLLLSCRVCFSSFSLNPGHFPSCHPDVHFSHAVESSVASSRLFFFKFRATGLLHDFPFPQN